MKCATSARAILPPLGGGKSARTRYSPLPGSLTSLVGRTGVQSRSLSLTSRSMRRTSAKVLAKILGWVCLAIQDLSRVLGDERCGGGHRDQPVGAGLVHPVDDVAAAGASSSV